MEGACSGVLSALSSHISLAVSPAFAARHSASTERCLLRLQSGVIVNSVSPCHLYGYAPCLTQNGISFSACFRHSTGSPVFGRAVLLLTFSPAQCYIHQLVSARPTCMQGCPTVAFVVSSFVAKLVRPSMSAHQPRKSYQERHRHRTATLRWNPHC